MEINKFLWIISVVVYPNEFFNIKDQDLTKEANYEPSGPRVPVNILTDQNFKKFLSNGFHCNLI